MCSVKFAIQDGRSLKEAKCMKVAILRFWRAFCLFPLPSKGGQTQLSEASSMDQFLCRNVIKDLKMDK